MDAVPALHEESYQRHPGIETHHVPTSPTDASTDVRYLCVAYICPGTFGLGGCLPQPCIGLQPTRGSLRYILHEWKLSQGGPTARAELYPRGWDYSRETLEADLVVTPTPEAPIERYTIGQLLGLVLAVMLATAGVATVVLFLLCCHQPVTALIKSAKLE